MWNIRTSPRTSPHSDAAARAAQDVHAPRRSVTHFTRDGKKREGQIAPATGDAKNCREKRPRWDSNPRITDLQSVPLVHLGTRPKRTGPLEILSGGGVEASSQGRGVDAFPVQVAKRCCLRDAGLIGQRSYGSALHRRMRCRGISGRCTWPIRRRGAEVDPLGVGDLVAALDEDVADDGASSSWRSSSSWRRARAGWAPSR